MIRTRVRVCGSSESGVVESYLLKNRLRAAHLVPFARRTTSGLMHSARDGNDEDDDDDGGGDDDRSVECCRPSSSILTRFDPIFIGARSVGAQSAGVPRDKPAWRRFFTKYFASDSVKQNNRRVQSGGLILTSIQYIDTDVRVNLTFALDSSHAIFVTPFAYVL